MGSRVPSGSTTQTPFVLTETMSAEANKSVVMSVKSGQSGGLIKPEERVIDQAVNQIFRTSSQVLLNCRGASSPFLEGARQVMRNMHELWTQKNLCDVTLECADGVLYAHKLVMAAYSDSLCKRFNDYPLSQAITISLREYSNSSVYTLLEFMYTTELKLTIHNVGELLSLATELGITFLIAYCRDFLCEITLENCFIFMEIAIKHNFKDLMDRVDKFLSDNFGDIIPLDGFVKMITSDRLIRFLTEGSRNIRGGELELFRAVVRWIEYRRPERMSLAPVLLRCVRLHLIAAQDLVSYVEKVDFVTGMPECFHMLYSAMTYHALNRSGGSPARQGPSY